MSLFLYIIFPYIIFFISLALTTPVIAMVEMFCTGKVTGRACIWGELSGQVSVRVLVESAISLHMESVTWILRAMHAHAEHRLARPSQYPVVRSQPETA